MAPTVLSVTDRLHDGGAAAGTLHLQDMYLCEVRRGGGRSYQPPLPMPV